MLILPKNHVNLVTMRVIIALLPIYQTCAYNAKPDSKDTLSITLVSVPLVISTMDSNQDAKRVLMSTLTVFLALTPLTLYNQLLSTKTSSIRQHGPLTFCQTLLRSLV